jgi:hypothetical protein
VFTRVANIFTNNRDDLRSTSSLESNGEVPLQYGGQPLPISHSAKVDVALVSTALILAGILLGLSGIFWVATR